MLPTGDTEMVHDLLQSILRTAKVGSDLAVEVLQLKDTVADLEKRNADLNAECLAGMTEISRLRAENMTAEAHAAELTRALRKIRARTYSSDRSCPLTAFAIAEISDTAAIVAEIDTQD